MSEIYEYNRMRVFHCNKTGEHHCSRCWKSLGKEFYIDKHLIPKCTNCNSILLIKTEAHVLKNYDGELNHENHVEV